MKYEKTKLNEDKLSKSFRSSHSGHGEYVLDQVGENKGGWFSSHDSWDVKESEIPIAYFIGISDKKHDKVENVAGLAGYHVDFSHSVTNFLDGSDYLFRDTNRDKLSNDLIIFKRYDFDRKNLVTDREKENEFTEGMIRYNCPIPVKRAFNKIFDDGTVNYQSVNLIDILRSKDLTNGLDFILYDDFKENIDEEVLKRINEKTGLEFIQEDKTRFPHGLYETLRNKNAWLFKGQ